MALVLRELEVGDEAAFKAAVDEFERTDPGWEFAFHFDPAASFADFVDAQRRGKRGEALPAGWVASTYFVGVVGGDIVGRLHVRHELNDFLDDYGGHIGFGVVASCRRRGYATEMMRQAIPYARTLGIDRLLLTCDEDNLASRTVIERCGGVFDDTRERDDGGVTRRYWISVA